MSSEGNRRLPTTPEPSSISDSSMDFSLNYPLYPGSFLQAPSARAVEADTITDSDAPSGNLLECPPALGETWRSVGFSEPFESAKRHVSQCSPNAGFIQQNSEKRPRLDGTSFSESDSLLFKSTLEGSFGTSLEQKSELLGGISESFDFASTPDPPDDNSNLAQSISLIQETLDQSIAQGDDRTCEQTNSLSRQQSQSSEGATSRLFGTDGEIPSGNIQAQSTPVDSIICNGNSAVLPRASNAVGSSSFDSFPSSANNKPVLLKEYRLVFTEQVFERNGEIIRRQMVQREQTLERTLQLTRGEYNNMMQILQTPLLSQVSDNFADISETSKDESSVGRKSVEKLASARSNQKHVETTDSIFESEPVVEQDVKKITSARLSAPDDQHHPRQPKSKVSTEPVRSAGSKSVKDALPKARDHEAADPEPEFKEPKIEKPDKHTPEKTLSSTAATATIKEDSSADASEHEDSAAISRLVIGSPCLAQWSDNLYYMATVSRLSRNGRYGVKFADGTQESVKGELLFPLKSELESGQPVYVKVRNVFEYAVIKDRTTVSQRPGYVAELHTKRVVRVTKDKLVFTQEMVDLLKEKQSGLPSDRESVRDKGPGGETGPSTLGKVRGRRPHVSGLDVTRSDGATSEATNSLIRSNSVKKNSKAEPSIHASESGGGASGSSLNPPTLVFEGMGFLLTDTERAVKNNKVTSSSSFESSGSQDEQIEFNKEQLQNLIEENGGVVFKSFTEAECANSLDTGIAERYLLSRSHMKTLKYVLCLAAGIRCLGHQIIYAALREGRMPEPARYQLPAGISLIQKIPIEQPSSHRLIFKDMVIAVVAEKNEFVNTWSQVIIAAGGRIASKLPQRQSPQQKTASSSNGTDGAIRYMVTTPECPGLTLRSARALRIAPVSSEWVVQSIIHAKVLEPDSHDAFAYDYKKTE